MPAPPYGIKIEIPALEHLSAKVGRLVDGAATQALELAWWDGCRTGAFAVALAALAIYVLFRKRS